MNYFNGCNKQTDCKFHLNEPLIIGSIIYTVAHINLYKPFGFGYCEDLPEKKKFVFMKHTKLFYLLFFASQFVVAQGTSDVKMNSFVSTLMTKMTLDEKIG